MAQNFGQLTDMWMTDPTMFDPTQASNQFSNFNNAPFPFPPTYNTGAGGPVNAGTGQPIQSFQQWQQQNPGGMSINATPAQPAAPQQSPLLNNPGPVGPGRMQGQYVQTNPGGMLPSGENYGSSSPTYMPAQYQFMPQQQQQQAPQAAPQASGPPNNWRAALNALSNPGNPQTMGATVPMVQGSQPAGGVNQAFLQQAQGRPGMNQNFLSALQAIQRRPGQ